MDFEIQIWVYDTLKVLKEFSDLDLFADKLIAYRNRREFRDLYDLGMMAKLIAGSDIAICKQKINYVLGDNKIIQDVAEAIELSLNSKEYSGYMHGLPREVAPLIRDRMFYTGLIDVIERI